MFIAAIFIIAKICEETKYPPTDELINKNSKMLLSHTNNGNFVEDCEGKGEKEQEEGVWGGKRAKLKAVMYT